MKKNAIHFKIMSNQKELSFFLTVTVRNHRSWVGPIFVILKIVRKVSMAGSVVVKLNP